MISIYNHYSSRGTGSRAQASVRHPAASPKRVLAQNTHPEVKAAPAHQPQKKQPAQDLNAFLHGLADSLLPNNIDGGDLLLAAVLLLVYLESKDVDFLIVLAVMAIAIFREGGL